MPQIVAQLAEWRADNRGCDGCHPGAVRDDPSLSRPAVSDDNPYSESLFKTLKYRPIDVGSSSLVALTEFSDRITTIKKLTGEVIQQLDRQRF